MRHASTDAEAAMWRERRAGRCDGNEFKRQQPIGPYIVDFVCFDRGLVIEVDGGQHVDRQARDDRRTDWLQSQGFRVLRFWNDDVLKHRVMVMDECFAC